MTKKLESYNEELTEMLQNLKSLQEKYLAEKEKFNEHLENIEEERKKIEEKAWLDETTKQAEIESMEKVMALKTSQLQKEMAAQLKSYETTKKHYVEKNKLTVDASKAQQAAELLKIDITTKAGQEELDSRMEVHQEILAEQENFTKALQALDAEMYPKDGGEKDAPKAWKDRWKDLVQKTGDYTNAINSSTTAMFGAITKNIDQDIAIAKEKITELTKKITSAKEELKQVQIDSANDLERSKGQLLADEENKEDGDAEKMRAELEELQTLYDAKHAMDEENKRRKDEAGYQDQQLAEDQLKRFNDLKGEHVDYALSLENKTNADKEAAEEVSNLEKEKEKQEAEVKKKEKEKKKVEAAQQVIQASVNIAQGITKAWALGPIAGPIMAAVVGAAGLVQMTFMGKQINKLKDGGLLRGLSHARGGMPILGSNVEVEGGEYVVNKQSTSKNLGLLEYINGERRGLGYMDMNTYFGEQSVPPSFLTQMMNEPSVVPQLPMNESVDTNRILSAIDSINFQPRVSVTDINTVHDNMVKVDEWTGL